MMPLLLAVVAGGIIATAAVAGAMFFLARSGRLPMQTAAPAVVAPREPARIATRAIVLEPLLVNLADGDGAAYLRLGVTLRVVEEPLKKGEKPKEEKPKEPKVPSEEETALRDTMLTVLGGQTAPGLLAADGKERLKGELKAAIALHDPQVKVTEMFFTEFLVQR